MNYQWTLLGGLVYGPLSRRSIYCGYSICKVEWLKVKSFVGLLQSGYSWVQKISRSFFLKAGREWGPQLQLPHQGWIRSQPFVQVDWGPQLSTSNLDVDTKNLRTCKLTKLLIWVNMISGAFPEPLIGPPSSLISSFLLQGWVHLWKCQFALYEFYFWPYVSFISNVWSMIPKLFRITLFQRMHCLESCYLTKLYCSWLTVPMVNQLLQ